MLTAVLGGLIWAGTLSAAEDLYDLDTYFQVQPDQVLFFKGGKSSPLEKEMSLANGAVLQTNGTLKLPGGLEKKIAPGQELTLDGLYMTKDGRFLPVIDFYMIDGGRTTIIQEGRSHPVEGVIHLKDGSQIMPTGWLVRPDGTRRRLLDGQGVDLDGRIVPSLDFILNKGGKIILQKDGALLSLEPYRVMAMSDGTRVTGQGEITRPDGSKLSLPEGSRLALAGAR